MLKWIAAAALLIPAAAQAQAQAPSREPVEEWYLTAANDKDTALIFVDRPSVRVQGDEATASMLIVSIDDGEGKEEAILFTVTFDCKRKAWKTLSGQMLDRDGDPIGPLKRTDSGWNTMSPTSFFTGPQEFACGGSVNPSADMRIGPIMPVGAGMAYLHGQHDKKKD
jgi:hypothetical protein